MEAAYVALPYHHPTIGWKSDIEHVPIAKLREFYDTFYWPNNATVTVVGDIETDAVLGLIKKYYGVYPHSPAPIPAIYTEEPAQSGDAARHRQAPGRIGRDHHRPQSSERPGRRSSGARNARCHIEFG